MDSENNIDHLLRTVHLGETPKWQEKLPDESIALTITSPPYYDDELYKLPSGENEFGWGNYQEYLAHIEEMLTSLFHKTIPGGRLVLILSNTPQLDPSNMVTHFWTIYHDVIKLALKKGWLLMDEIIWSKLNPNYPYISSGFIPETQLIQSHDTIGVLRKPGPLRVTLDQEKHNTVWEFDSQGPINTYNKVYPSFPDELLERIINLWSLPSDIVFDPYAGSGQVVRVANRLKRKGLGVEIDIQWKELWKDLD